MKKNIGLQATLRHQTRSPHGIVTPNMEDQWE
jgi:hypothetical protein